LAFQVPIVPELMMSANDFGVFGRILKHQTKGAIGEEEIAYFKQAWAQPGALSASVEWYRVSLRAWMRGRLKDLSVRAPSLLIWGEVETLTSPRARPKGLVATSPTLRLHTSAVRRTGCSKIYPRS
jgi:epoxide hydrolase 4